MTKVRFRVQDIQSLQPAIDQRNIDKVYVLDGKNYYFDSKGPKSGFGTRLVADNSLIENAGGVVQSITAGKATYVFTSKGCYVLADNQKTWIRVLDLASRWPDVPLKDDKKWTFVYLTKGVYFCHPVYGFYKVVKTPTDYYLDPRDQTDIPGLPFQPQAIFETNGRMVVLGFKYVAWSGPSNAEDFLPALGGAGQELLSDRIAGNPVTGVGFQNGFIVWTLQGCLTAEFIGGDTVFRFDRLTTEQLPVNSFAVEAMPDGSQVICTKQGLYQIQNAKEPSQIAPLFSEFIRQRLEHENGIHIRITYALEEDLLFFQMRDWTNHYVHTYVCAIALDKWGSFNERHLGIIKLIPERGHWGYVDHDGRPHRFIETFNREKTPHNFIGLDSNIVIGYMKPPELQGETDSLLEMHEINIGGHPAIPSWYEVDYVDLGNIPTVPRVGHLHIHGVAGAIFGLIPIPLDGIAIPTSAYSMARKLLPTFTGPDRYTIDSGISSFVDQSGHSHDWTQASITRHAIVSAIGVSNRIAPSFDGFDDLYANAGTMDTLITTTDGLAVAVIKAESISQNNILPWSNEMVFGDLNGYLGIGLKASGGGPIAQFFNFHGGDWQIAEIPITIGAVHVLMWRHSAGVIYGSIDGGAEVQVASLATPSLTGDVALLANNGYGGGTVGIDGIVAELVTWNATQPTPLELATYIADCLAYYS